MSSIYPLVKARIQQYTPAQPARPATAQVTRVYLQPGEIVPGSTWTITVTDADGATHAATYEALPSDGQTEIINGILAALSSEEFDELVVTANYDLRFITIVSPGYITVQAAVFIAGGGGLWEEVLFPYALAEPVIRGAYSDGLREAGQTDKGMAEEQGAVAEVMDRGTKALAPGFTDLTDQRAPAARYRGKLQGQNAPK